MTNGLGIQSLAGLLGVTGTLAFAIGRDHLSATIHTLVLAYAGGVLPLLLAMSLGNVNGLDAVNGQSIAVPIVATIFGMPGAHRCHPRDDRPGLDAALARARCGAPRGPPPSALTQR